jgi:hypothetical protein
MHGTRTMGWENSKRIFLVVDLILISIMLVSVSACIGERIAPIMVQNNTEETLSIFIDGVCIGDVASGEEIRNDIIWITARFVIEARNSQGQIVYKEEITYENMKKIDWKVIISPQTEKMSSDNVTTISDNMTEQ